jgi:3alpha(or 20beta)-hydroxysteroid dehydrogenase
MGQLDGRIALVTGAGGGMGAAITRLFAAEGAQVIAGDLPGVSVAPEPGVVPVQLDVADEASWGKAIDTARAVGGVPTVLINNAGIDPKGAIGEQSPEQFLDVLRVNLFGAWLGIRAVLPGMRARGGGAIVNISSAAAFSGTFVSPGLAAYTSSKWGLRGLTKVAALELGADGIRVNSIHPGVIDTPMARDLVSAGTLLRGNAIKRPGTPDEIAQLALFLASDRSSYSTGAEFLADGGLTAGRAR